MSTITITFQVQELTNQAVRGEVSLAYNDGNMQIPLRLKLTQGAPSAGFFQEVSFVPLGFPATENNEQAERYASAFNRDFRNVGGRSNLRATVTDNTVTITANEGVFIEGNSVYTGNILIVTRFNVVNTAQPDQLTLVAQNTAAGSGCDNIIYEVTASGGTPPYALFNVNSPLITNWSGITQTFPFSRESAVTGLRLTDSGFNSRILPVLVPSKIKIGEFKERISPHILGGDVLIENVNPILGTLPIEYSLDAQDAIMGTNYSEQNSFPNVLAGTYKLFVRDRYGCVINKTIVVTALDDGIEEQLPRYFDVMQGNSIIFSPNPTFGVNTKKNYSNTLSSNEDIENSYPITQAFDPTDFEPTQFKSSYPYHVVTLYKCDGTTIGIQPLMIQENIGAKEKVDCKLFPIEGKTGVYFDGGNEYLPDTDTVTGPSEYVQFTPSWVREDQIVTISGLGSYRIEEVGYRQDIGRGYFTIAPLLGSARDATIQVTRNIQDYNVFEFFVPFNLFTRGRIVIEKGYDFDNIDGDPWCSELLRSYTDDKALLFKWKSTKNIGDIVYQSGIEMTKRKRGEFRPDWDGASDTSDGDSRVFSLQQTSYLRYNLYLEDLTAREVQQMVIATALDGFEINNLSLIRVEYPEITPLRGTNLYSFDCKLGYQGDSLAVQQDEIVLNPSTGDPNGGGTGKPGPLPIADGKIRLNIGGFISVGGKFIEV